ncbi:hypothetical protein ASF49_20210 [Methylobacterium sp. Leaf104]|uniref:DUF2147 domain-containing protein n=1 Tax=Methylobacterium TaxID=407 RepID=UPI0006F4580D|nr:MULTISPECIES: DUF2147 domain-containing protein [Methylobacterium]KQP40697.1 hypothetical protein ASF49_20210 [Methylobacterium sp. Leaf104]MCI9881077.1 DUF2147 domain-containing protein [Methylobacterium goesingense]
MAITGRVLRSVGCAVALTVLLEGVATAQQGKDASGLWLTETGASKVRISRCGDGYCGTLTSVAGPGLDAKNPDPALRSRSLVGVQIMNTRTAGTKGYEGTLYNPNDGKTYAGTMTIKGPDTVEVSGCVMSVFCKTQSWKRVN